MTGKEEGDRATAGSRPDKQALSLEADHVYEALAHPRRRYLCYALLEDEEWSLSHLATKVAAWERGVSEQEVTDQQRERVYVSLSHSHIPKLADEGIVTFDETDAMIRVAENATEVLRALQAMDAHVDTD